MDAAEAMDPGEGGARGRPAAGADPRKREQILEGAWRAFRDRGFDAASMEDVRREAGVSKGTLYVYFEGKEELFEALVERQRDGLLAGLAPLLDGPEPLADRLGRFGRRLAALMCSDEAIRAQRAVIHMAERMPHLSARFHDGGVERAQGPLRRALQGEAEAGRLRVPDVPATAQRFVDLALSGLWRPRLYGVMPRPPSEAQVAAAVAEAVRFVVARNAPA